MSQLPLLILAVMNFTPLSSITFKFPYYTIEADASNPSFVCDTDYGYTAGYLSPFIHISLGVECGTLYATYDTIKNAFNVAPDTCPASCPLAIRPVPQYWTQIEKTVYITNGRRFQIYDLTTTTIPFANLKDSTASNINFPQRMDPESMCLTSTIDNQYLIGIGGLIYLADTPSNLVQIYDLINEIWLTAPDIPDNRFGAGCVVHQYNNMLYVIGGSPIFNEYSDLYYGLFVGDMKSIQTYKWETYSNPTFKNEHFGRLIPYDKYLIVLGGYMDAKTFGGIVVLDVNKQPPAVWDENIGLGLAQMQWGNAAVQLVDDRIYMFGGGGSGWHFIDLFLATTTTTTTTTTKPPTTKAPTAPTACNKCSCACIFCFTEACYLEGPNCDYIDGKCVSATAAPTINPTPNPTAAPSTTNPTKTPTTYPITSTPTKSPTTNPSITPTTMPTKSPTKIPTVTPTSYPTKSPTKTPTSNPTKSPTKTPTSNPTKSPTKNPTIQPTNIPSITPTSDPSITPTSNPSITPTSYPTKSPTKIPTITPTKNPSIIPTITPTSNPSISPSSDPSKTPTHDPTAIPTSIPTIDPTESQTLVPTITPTTHPSNFPTNNPSFLPTSYPTTHPSNAPSTDATYNPTHTPTNDPTVDPTYDPSNDPTDDPTFEPTFRPTNNPTMPPTFCLLSTYQKRMFPGENDKLYKKQSLVSDNCLCQLVMKGNGNLILSSRKNTDKKSKFVDGWMTDTRITNRSQEGEPIFSIQNDGVIKIEEILYKNAPSSFEPVLIWKATHSGAKSSNYDLYLSDQCCLNILETNIIGRMTSVWSVCVYTNSPSMSPTDPLSTGPISEDEDDFEFNNSSSGIAEKLWWLWLLLILCLIIPVSVWIVHKKHNGVNNKHWITPSIKYGETQHEGDDTCNDKETEQIEQWMQETMYNPNSNTNTFKIMGEANPIIMSSQLEYDHIEMQVMESDAMSSSD